MATFFSDLVRVQNKLSQRIIQELEKSGYPTKSGKNGAFEIMFRDSVSVKVHWSLAKPSRLQIRLDYGAKSLRMMEMEIGSLEPDRIADRLVDVWVGKFTGDL